MVGSSLDGLGEHCGFSIAVTTFSRQTKLSTIARTFALRGKSYVGEKFLQDKALNHLRTCFDRNALKWVFPTAGHEH